MTPSQSTKSSAIRLALIGAGAFASSAHYSVLSKLQTEGRVYIHLAWSRRASSAKSLAGKYGQHVVTANSETSEDEISSVTCALREHQSNLDAVILCVPIPQNAQFTRAILSLGINVFCEKPLAHDLTSAKQLLNMNITSMYAVGENFRFESVFQRARTLIQQNQPHNKILGITLNAQTPMPTGSKYAFGWRLNKLSGAGILKDGFVHSIAGLRVLLNCNISTVSAKCSSNAPHFENGCDTAVATFTFENDISASIFVSYASSVFEWRLVIVGSLFDIIIERAKGRPGYNLIVRDGQGIKSEEFIQFCGIDLEFETFIDSCRSGSLDQRLSAREAFNDLAPVQSMFQSSNEGKIVEVIQAP